jgi:hypothetical protein
MDAELSPEQARLAIEADILTHMVAAWLVKHDPAERDGMLRSLAYAVTRVAEELKKEA